MGMVVIDSDGNDITDEFFKGADSTARDMDDPKMSCRETVLEEAKRCICQDRQNQYGEPEDSFFTIAQFWSTYLAGEKKLTHALTKEDVALMMVLLKVARTNGHKHHVDNYVDMAGYAALAAELAEDELCISEI
jgi:hypothetical protein